MNQSNTSKARSGLGSQRSRDGLDRRDETLSSVISGDDASLIGGLNRSAAKSPDSKTSETSSVLEEKAKSAPRTFKK